MLEGGRVRARRAWEAVPSVLLLQFCSGPWGHRLALTSRIPRCFSIRTSATLMALLDPGGIRKLHDLSRRCTSLRAARDPPYR